MGDVSDDMTDTLNAPVLPPPELMVLPVLPLEEVNTEENLEGSKVGNPEGGARP